MLMRMKSKMNQASASQGLYGFSILMLRYMISSSCLIIAKFHRL
jgi:hypothetical protein